MWMGEKITDRGVGNGISILIMVGILADFPQALINAFEIDNTGGIAFTMQILGLLFVIFLCVLLVQAVRKVPVQYVRRAQVGSSSYMRSVTDSVRSYIPLKVNASGVIVWMSTRMHSIHVAYSYVIFCLRQIYSS